MSNEEVNYLHKKKMDALYEKYGSHPVIKHLTSMQKTVYKDDVAMWNQINHIERSLMESGILLPTPASQPQETFKESIIRRSRQQAWRRLGQQQDKDLVDWIQKQKYSKENENTSEENAWSWVALFYSRLKELCELKRIKDTDGKTEDYLERQPMAWYAAQQTIVLFDKDNNAPPSWQASQPGEAAEFAEWACGKYNYAYGLWWVQHDENADGVTTAQLYQLYQLFTQSKQ